MEKRQENKINKKRKKYPERTGNKLRKRKKPAWNTKKPADPADLAWSKKVRPETVANRAGLVIYFDKRKFCEVIIDGGRLKW